MLSNQRTRAQGIPQIAEKCNRLHDSLAAKLERTRLELRRAQENVQASEGRFLNLSTAEVITRALLSAARNLQELTLQVACLERKR